MTMVGKQEKPNCYSERFQQAQRVNCSETTRLRLRMKLIDRERLHIVRCLNNDVRLLKASLKKISISSGESPEGRPPWYKETREEREKPRLIMYGDRIRQKKIRRKRTIVFGKMSPSTDSSDDESLSELHFRTRPSTCPPGRKSSHRLQKRVPTSTRFADNVRVCDSEDEDRYNKKNNVKKRRATTKSAPLVRRKKRPTAVRLPTLHPETSEDDSRPTTTVSCW